MDNVRNALARKLSKHKMDDYDQRSEIAQLNGRHAQLKAGAPPVVDLREVVSLSPPRVPEQFTLPVVTKARTEDTLDLQIFYVDAGTVVVDGDFLVFTQFCAIKSGSDNGIAGPVIKNILNSWPDWWSVKAPGASHRFTVEFSAPGAIAVKAGQIISGANQPFVDRTSIGTNMPVSVRSLVGSTVSYRRNQPQIAHPGTFLTSLTKSAAIAGVSGYTSLVSIAFDQPNIYVVFRFLPPNGDPAAGTGPSRSLTPMFAALQKNDGTKILLGDLSSYATDVTRTLIIAASDPVGFSDVGVWFPSGESATNALTLKYWKIDGQVYVARNFSSMPTGGGLMPKGAASF